MTIRVELQPQVYKTNLNNMLHGSSSDVLGTFKGIPTGNFTNVDASFTQYSVFETSFRVTTDSVGKRHTIRATLVSLDNNFTVASKNRIVEKTIVPVNNTFVITLPLRKGENQIDVFTDNDNTFTTVLASHVGTFVTAYAREIFNSTQNPLDEQTRALFSRFSSRMPEILIPFQDLYADPKSLRTLISRFLTRAYMTKNGSTEGVRDFTAALLGTTPIFVPTKTDEGVFEPNVVPLFRRQLEFSGFEAHTWIPNFEIVHWLSFIRLIDAARNYYTIEEIGESEVLVRAGGIPEIHRFDFDNPAATAYSEFNFTDFRVIVKILSKLNIRICAAGYPFDLFITAENPLGDSKLFLDSGIVFDSGETWDSGYLDPGDDGWIGFPLSGRFEQYALNSTPIQFALDSLFITPAFTSMLDECVYEGFLTQQLMLYSQVLETDFEISVDGEVNEGVGTSEENISIAEYRADVEVLNFSNISDFSLSGDPGGIIEDDTTISLVGLSSVRYIKNANGSNAVITWNNPGAPINLSVIGADIVYFTTFFGEDALASTASGIPSYPGKVASIAIEFEDSLGNFAGYVYHKEHFVRGTNILPIMLGFPDGNFSGILNKADIVVIRFIITPVDPNDTWSEVYLGGFHSLVEDASFTPGRAKIELEDIDNVYPQSLYGSELEFTYSGGGSDVFTADEIYNNLETNAYVPKFYKVELTSGIGTENFNREQTAENLRVELARHGNFTKVSVIDNLPGEIYLDLFTKEFSSAASQNTLTFTPSPLNPYSPDLIDVTNFSGGVEGQRTNLGGSSGFKSIAQKFTVSSTVVIRFAEIFLYKVGAPVGNLRLSIHLDNPLDPAGTAPAAVWNVAVDKPATEVTGALPGYTLFRFEDTLSLGAGDYWLVITGDETYETNVDDYVIWGKSTAGGALGSAVTDNIFTAGSFWTVSLALNHFFKVIGDV